MRAPSAHKVPSDDSTATSGGTVETDPSTGTSDFNNALSLHAQSSMDSNVSFVSARSSGSNCADAGQKVYLRPYADPGVTNLDHFHSAARTIRISAK